MSRKEALLLELYERLAPLRTVTAFTKMVAMGAAQHEDDDAELAWYLTHILPIIEKFIEPIEYPEFLELCSRIGNTHEEFELAKEFEFSEDFTPMSWFMANNQWAQARDQPRQLAALANHFAIPIAGMHREPRIRFHSLACLASLLGLDHRSHEGVGLYQFAMGWDDAVLRDRKQLHKAFQAFAVDPIMYLQATSNVSEELFKAGRITEATDVVFAALGFLMPDIPTAAQLYAAICQLQHQKSAFYQTDPGQELPGEVRDALASAEVVHLGSIFQVLRFRHPQLTVDLVVHFADCASAPVAAEIVNKLKARYSVPIARQFLEILLGQYSSALGKLGRHADAVAVAETWIGIGPVDYADSSRLSQCLAGYQSRGNFLDGGMFFLGTFATALRRLDRDSHSATVSECMFAGSGATLRLSRSLAQVRELLGGGGDTQRLSRAIAGAQRCLKQAFGPDHAVLAIASWIRSLRLAGREPEAYWVATETLGDLEWLKIKDGRLQGSITNLIAASFELLLLVAPRDLERAVEICRRTIEALRATVADLRISPADRLEYQEVFADLRQLIVSCGYDWAAAASNPADRQSRWVQALAWDAELGQRAILERLIAKPPPQSRRAMPALPRLSPAAPTPVEISQSVNVSLDQVSSGIRPPPPLPFVGNEHPDGQALAQQLMSGIGERELVKALLPHERLLRIMFTGDGRIAWGLFAPGNSRQSAPPGLSPTADRLQLLLDGVGKPGYYEKILAAVKRHDLELEIAWLAGKPAAQAAYPRLEGQLHSLLATIPDLPLEAQEHWQAFCKATARFSPEISRRLQAAYGDFFTGTSGELPMAQARETVERLLLLFTIPQDFATAQRRLDAPTAELLRVVAQVWPTDAIAGQLDPKTHDLLIQADDLWHAIPIPYLPANGGYLFEAARSTRSVLSAVFAGWLKERDRPTPSRQGDLRGLMLSWFEAGDFAAIGNRILQHDLAQIPGAWHWQLATGDLGAHEVLQAVVQEPLQLAVVFGHGSRELAGVTLRDGVWSGTRVCRRDGDGWQQSYGCDLAQVDFLLQVSCSIGKLEHHEGQDVSGFCIEIAVAGGRAVLAGKWPLSCVEAPRFAACVAAEYARLRGEPSTSAIPDQALRARAVAHARRELRPGSQGKVGLNTAAGFDLYGAG
jgi:hypothetical protein